MSCDGDLMHIHVTQVSITLPDYKYKDEYDQLVYIEQRTAFYRLIKQYHER